jgi:hypothetical protein
MVISSFVLKTKTRRMTKMSGQIIVVVQGGCVTDVLGVQSYNVFDWDNFEDNPESYVEDNGGLEGEFFQQIEDLSPDLFADIEDAYYKAVRYREDQRRKDPFCDVPAV